MSSKQVSLASNSTTSRNFRKLRKFQFSDLSLSYQVRKRLYEMLISFDDNVNYEFEKQEIKKALIEILDETQTQISYVLNNVFRYDSNHDGIVTYEEFANFCLEQHFGEMAIQRLHKVSTYSRGKERVMAREEFVKTLDYCLSFITIKPIRSVLETAFNEVDADRDGFITYADYFGFLKEYFGSQSQSATVVTVMKVEEDLKKIYGQIDRNIMKEDIFKEKKQKNDENAQKLINSDTSPKTITLPKIITTPPVQTNNSQKGTNQLANSFLKSDQFVKIGQRISRLIYQQLRITTIEHDENMTLLSQQKVAYHMLTQILKISMSKAKEIISQAFDKNLTVSYEVFIKYAIEKFMSETVVDGASYPLSKHQFIQQINKNLYFVRAKPFNFMLEQLFDKFEEKAKKNSLSKQDFKEIIEFIFSSYDWPRRTGELRKKQTLIPKPDNYRTIRY